MRSPKRRNILSLVFACLCLSISLLIKIYSLIRFIFDITDMVAKKLIAFVAFVMLITLLEQIKSGVHAGRMTKAKRGGRVKVIHTGPRVRKLKKKVEELKKKLASMEPCERKKHFTSQYYSL